MASSVNKKVRSLFFRDKDIVYYKKRLKELNKKKRTLKNDTEETAAFYNDVIENLSSGRYDSFPLESIYDLCEFSSDCKNDFKLPMMVLRSSLEGEYLENVSQIQELESDIKMNELDILIAKVKCVQRKM